MLNLYPVAGELVVRSLSVWHLVKHVQRLALRVVEWLHWLVAYFHCKRITANCQGARRLLPQETYYFWGLVRFRIDGLRTPKKTLESALILEQIIVDMILLEVQKKTWKSTNSRHDSLRTKKLESALIVDMILFHITFRYLIVSMH